MKKLIFNILLVTVAATTQAQDSVYYYYAGEKIYLAKESNVKPKLSEP